MSGKMEYNVVYLNDVTRPIISTTSILNVLCYSQVKICGQVTVGDQKTKGGFRPFPNLIMAHFWSFT